MEKNNQSQKAGDNSQQIQAETINIINGITEQRAREIYRDEFNNSALIREQEALIIAQSRVRKLEDIVIPKMAQIDKALEAFADPAFQFVLRDAQKTASCTERATDYELLSELLIDRVSNGKDRKRALSINEAVKIVDRIDDDALCALTILFVVNFLQSSSGSISNGIQTLSDLFESLVICELPNGEDWLNHLELLNTIKTNNLVSLNKLIDIFSGNYSGYTCVGIEKNSNEHRLAEDILKEAKLFPELLLSDHELNPNYIRLNTRSLERLEDVRLNIIGVQLETEYTEEQYEALEKVVGLYKNDTALKTEINERFKSKMLSFKSIRKVVEWWDSIPYAITITQVGKVLGNANAQKLNPIIPKII